MSRRIGILGGTFDPIHRGHVDLAAAAERALGLTTIFLVPSSVPPHRAHPVASGFHRFAMTALAVSDRPAWQASDVELQSQAPSYTADTLARFQARGFIASELFFITGADAFLEIPTWKNYPALLDAANFAVISRPGCPVSELRRRLPALGSRMIRPDAAAQRASKGSSIFLIDAPTADVSSTAIRQRRWAGLSISKLVDPRVAQHIERHGLYVPAPQDEPAPEPSGHSPAGRMHGQS